MKGLRKDHVDKISANDLATALDDMKDTINQIVDDMDKTTLDTMIKKVKTVDSISYYHEIIIKMQMTETKFFYKDFIFFRCVL